MAKTLLVLRHGKAEPAESVEKTDFDRELTARGESNSLVMGDHISQKGLKPDLVISSQASRALKTARNVASRCGDPPLEENETMYGAYSPDLLEILMGLDDSVATVLLVGHNPALENLVDELTDSYDTVLKTCSLAVLKTTKKKWADIMHGDFKTIEIQNPRDLDPTV
ncbi:histidine phosphatase family protein [bacterium]|nr:histidine phosphatase family protein [bacterium]